MNEECVVAVYPDLHCAQEAAHILERGGIRLSHFTIVTNDLPDKVSLLQDANLVDDSLRDAVIGGGVGAVVGILAGTLVNIITGPFSGGLLGVAVGAFIGSMGGWGVHQERLHHYETLLSEGKILLIVVGNPLELIKAEQMLQETVPEEVKFTAKTSSEFPEVNPEEHVLHQRH